MVRDAMLKVSLKELSRASSRSNDLSLLIMMTRQNLGSVPFAYSIGICAVCKCGLTFSSSFLQFNLNETF
ncbi:hypothetical protein BDV09DRAFT_171096 [Aspergillus tetrazonus]